MAVDHHAVRLRAPRDPARRAAAVLRRDRPGGRLGHHERVVPARIDLHLVVAPAADIALVEGVVLAERPVAQLDAAWHGRRAGVRRREGWRLAVEHDYRAEATGDERVGVGVVEVREEAAAAEVAARALPRLRDRVAGLVVEQEVGARLAEVDELVPGRRVAARIRRACAGPGRSRVRIGDRAARRLLEIPAGGGRRGRSAGGRRLPGDLR